MEIITKQQAVAAGLKYFYTGKPCKYGHLTTRYVGNGACSECLRPKAALVISKPGEIITLEKLQEIEFSGDKLKLERLELRRQELEVQRQKTFLRAQQAQINQFRIVDREERRERRERRDTVKSKLVEVILFVHELDHSSVSLMNWGFAAMRDPRLKIEDLAVRQMPDSRFVFRCFPEDKAEIMRAAQNLWDLRQGDFKSEIEERKLAVAAELERAALDNGQPEDDPR